MTDTWQMDNVIILGDLNASGQYIKSRDWETNRLRGAEYNWLIPDHVDTTATNTLAAYDRLVIKFSFFNSSLKFSGYFKIFFKKIFGLHANFSKFMIDG